MYFYIITKTKNVMTKTSKRTANLSYSQKISSTKNRLKFGDIKRVAQTSGFSASYVSQVLSGQYKNERIVNVSYNLTKNRVSNASKVSQMA